MLHKKNTMTFSTTATMRSLLLLSLLSLLLTSRVHADLLKKLMVGRMNRGDSAEDDSSTTAATTCDSLLAKSLVTANELKAVVELELEEALKTLEAVVEDKTRLEQELQDTQEKLMETITESKETLVSVQQDARDAVERVQQERDAAIQHSNLKMEKLSQESAEEIQEIRQETAAQIAQVKQEASALVEQKDLELSQMKTHYMELTEAVREEASRNMSRVVNDSELSIATLQEEHEKQLQELTDKMQQDQLKSRQELETCAKDATTALSKKEKEYKNQLSHVEAEYKTKLEASTQKLQALETKWNTEKRERASLESKLSKAEAVRRFHHSLFLTMCVHCINNDSS